MFTCPICGEDGLLHGDDCIVPLATFLVDPTVLIPEVISGVWDELTASDEE
jgi:hypothetical protein